MSSCIVEPTTEHASLVALLRMRASSQANQRACTFLVDGEREEIHLTYGELDARARTIAAWLQQRGLVGQRALLLYAPGLDYIAAFFGCLYAGVIAVPAYPPDLTRMDRTATAFAPCGFRRQAFFPCYGLAEATLIVSGAPKALSPMIQSRLPGPSGVDGGWSLSAHG